MPVDGSRITAEHAEHKAHGFLGVLREF